MEINKFLEYIQIGIDLTYLKKIKGIKCIRINPAIYPNVKEIIHTDGESLYTIIDDKNILVILDNFCSEFYMEVEE